MIPLLFLDTNHGFGGDTQVLLDLLESLAETGYRPTVACVADGILCKRLQALQHVEVIPLDIVEKHESNARTFARKLIAAGQRLVSWSWEQKPRVIHLNTALAGSAQTLAVSLKRLGWPGSKLVTHAHCTPKTNRMSRITLAASDEIWAVSESVASLHRQLVSHPERIKILFNPVKELRASDEEANALRAALALAPTDELAGLIGRLSPNKGQHIAIEAIGLDKRFERTHLVLVGDDRVADGNTGYREELFELAERFGVSERVHFVGYVSDPSAWYRACDAIVIPSAQEGFCLVAAEALLANRPVIGADIDGLREVLGEIAGLPLVERTPEAFAAAMAKTLDSPQPERIAAARERILDACGLERFRASLRLYLGHLTA